MVGPLFKNKSLMTFQNTDQVIIQVEDLPYLPFLGKYTGSSIYLVRVVLDDLPITWPTIFCLT